MLSNNGITRQSWLNVWGAVKSTLGASQTVEGILKLGSQIFPAGKKVIVGGGNTSATNAFEVHNSTGTSASLVVSDDGKTVVVAGQSIYNAGTYNQFFGHQAGHLNTTGDYNQFFGYQTGYSNTTGVRNQFFGQLAGYSNTAGDYNQFFGYVSGYSNTTGAANQFFGYQTGYSNTTGYYNQFFGHFAGYSNTTGALNQFIGYVAGYANTTGVANQFFGYQAGYSNTTGSNNQFFGKDAGYSNTTGSNNQFFGISSGSALTTESGNAVFNHPGRVGMQNTVIIADGASNAVFVGSVAGGHEIPQLAAAPTYKKGSMYFDTTLNKLRIGGASAWETITSV